MSTCRKISRKYSTAILLKLFSSCPFLSYIIKKCKTLFFNIHSYINTSGNCMEHFPTIFRFIRISTIYIKLYIKAEDVLFFVNITHFNLVSIYRNAINAASLLQAVYLPRYHQADIRIGCACKACTGFMITSLLQVVNGLEENRLSQDFVSTEN